MHSTEMSQVKFSSTKFREGYITDEVDDFVNSVQLALQKWESGSPGKLSAHDVVHARFTPVKFRSGYDETEVDDFLDKVAEALSAYEAGMRP